MFDHAVSLLYRPKNLKRLVDGHDTAPFATLPYYQDTTIVTSTENLKEAMNK